MANHREQTDEWDGYEHTEGTAEIGGDYEQEGVEELPERRTYGAVNRFFHQHLGGSPVDWFNRTRDRFREAFDVIGDEHILGPVARDAESDKNLGVDLFAYSKDESMPARVRQACAGAGKLTERNIGTVAYVEALGILSGFQEAMQDARDFRGDAVDSAGSDVYALQRVLDAVEAHYETLDLNELPDNVATLVERCTTNLNQNVGVGPELKRLASAESRITSGGSPLKVWHVAAVLAAGAIGFATAFEMGSRSHAEHGAHPTERVVNYFTGDAVPAASAASSTEVPTTPTSTATTSTP